MTARLYYTAQALTAFDAIVGRCEASAEGWAVRLDQSAFYPTSGGQPHDLGTLGDARVHDVIEDEHGDIVHLVDRAMAVGSAVHGEVDWPRRFDHMQQHTGQHVLSAAFDRLLQVPTVSVHIGGAVATIDLGRDVTAADLARAEREANQVIWEDRSVTVRFATPEDAARLPLRKDPVRTGLLRLVEIDGVDLSACGGTHVARTGMIGQVAIVESERYKGAARITFVCGGRALRAHGHLREVVAGATRALSVGADDLAGAIERGRAALKEAVRLRQKWQEVAARLHGAELQQHAEPIGPVRLAMAIEPDLDAAGLKDLASAVVSAPGVIAALAGRGVPLPVVLACGSGVTVSAGLVLKQVVAALGGRGGGSDRLAQGGVQAEAPAFFLEVRRRVQAVVSAPES